MKTIILTLSLLLSIVTYSQTDVTNILNAELPGIPGELVLGCCNEDGLSPEGTNTDLCVWQDYVAYGDINLQRIKLTLRQCSLTIIDGNFVTNGFELDFTCDAELRFEGENPGRLATSWDELNTLSIKQLPDNLYQIPVGLPYTIYTLPYNKIEGTYSTYQEIYNKVKSGFFILNIEGYSPRKYIIH